MPTYSHGCREEGGVTKYVKDIFAGWHQDGLSLSDVDTVDVGLTPQAHDDDEGVAAEIDLLCHLNHHAVNNEIRTVDKLACRFCRVIRRAVFRPYLVVDSILRLLDVQFTWIAVGIFPPEIIDAVGNIARLLNFCQEVPCSNGMQTPRRQEVQIALVSLMGEWPFKGSAVASCSYSSGVMLFDRPA